jgi:FecR protein.
MNFRRTEKIIFAVSVVALLLFSYFLYDDSLLFPKSNSGTMELVGSVSISQNDVRRKGADSFSWIPASKKDEVFQNDAIFTGDDSQASIQLKDGTVIKLDPNSLVTLNLKDGQMNLDLRYGNLVGDLAQGSALTITSDGEEINLKSDPQQGASKVEFNKSHSGNLDLKVLTGKVSLKDKKSNQKKEIAQNENVAVSKKGEVRKVEKPEVHLLGQNGTEFLRINPDDVMSFAWSGKGDISRYSIEISQADDFKTLVTSKVLSDKKISIQDPIQPGQYHWRVKAYDLNGKVAVTTAPWTFTVNHLQAPKITTPVTAASFNYEMKVKTPEELVYSTEVQWQSAPQLKAYTFQVADDAEFSHIINESQTAEKAALTPKLPSGAYWVRVRGQTAEKGLSPWSDAVQFNVQLTAKVEEKPSRPILITKKIAFTPPKAGDRNPAATEAPRMEWKPAAKSVAYILQVSKDKSFKGASRFDVTTTAVNWAQYRPGQHYFRVYAKSADGIYSEPSEVGEIDVAITNPILNPLSRIDGVGMTPTPRDIPVSWTEIPFAKSYLVEIDKDANFTSPTQLEVASASGKVTLPGPGSYNMRVKAKDENNQDITQFSNIEQVLYSFRNPLTSPALLEPFNKASIFLQGQLEPFIWLEWKKVEGATTYQVEISSTPDFKKVLISKNIKGNRYLIKEQIPLGKIYWRVRAESATASEYSEWTSQREFTVYHQKNENFVE